MSVSALAVTAQAAQPDASLSLKQTADRQKRAAAKAAVGLVEDGMVLGLGTGSTANFFVMLLGERIQDGLRVHGVPTSIATSALSRDCGIPVLSLREAEQIDLCVDGVDEVDGDLNAIKGGGGALLREKVVASAADRVVYIADGSKIKPRIGKFPLPVEVTPFATEVVRRKIRLLGCEPVLRMAADGMPFRTDERNFILDCPFELIEEPDALAAELSIIPGVVEHGLFLGMIDRMIIAGDDGIATYS